MMRAVSQPPVHALVSMQVVWPKCLGRPERCAVWPTMRDLPEKWGWASSERNSQQSQSGVWLAKVMSGAALAWAKQWESVSKESRSPCSRKSQWSGVTWERRGIHEFGA